MALVSPPRGSGSRTPSNKKAKTPGCRKARQDKPSKEEDERRRIRRERNKIAAAKCRSRRRELIDTLQAETEQLEDEKSILRSEIDELLKEKERLEQVLSSHGSSCKLKSKADEDEDEEDMAVPSPKGAGIPAAAILGNSDLFLSASVQDEQEESLQELKDDLDDLIPSLETEGVTSEAAAGAFVPDIADLSAPLCPPDWETLYKSVADDLECLGAPSYGGNQRVGVFSFNLAEMDALAPEGGFEDNLNSPTLLAL